MFMFYASDLLHKSLEGMSEPTAVFLVYFVNMIATGISIFLLGRFGRKTLMFLGSSVQTISLLFLGIFMFAENKTFPIIFSLINVAFFEFSSGPIVWLYLAEISSDKGASLCTIANALTNMCFAIFPNIVTK